MEATEVRSRLGGVTRLVAALVGLATPPALLAFVVGNPVPAWPIDWAHVVESIQAGLVPSSVWVNVLAVVAWVTWMVLVGMLAVEVVAVARHRPSAPAVPGWIRGLAQALVAAAIALAGPGQHTVAAVETAPPVVATAPAAHADGLLLAEAQSDIEGRFVTVGEGDSWSGFAAEVLGDASLGPRLREANLGRPVGNGETVTENTAFVEPGWRLLVPTHLDTAGAQVVDVSGDVEEQPGTWDVERGDHFWAIAETTLAEAWGRAPTDAEIDPYWRQVVDANRDRLLPPHDPDLVYPGQQFVVPTPPADPDAPAPAANAEPPRDGWREAIEGRGAGGPDVEAPEDGTPWQEAIEESAIQEPAADSADGAAEEDEARTAFGLPVGLTAGVAAASLLAAGAVATLRWRRRTALQQRLPGLRLPTPLPEAEPEEAKLAAAAPAEPVLDDLAAVLVTIPPDTHPVLIMAADDGEITLLFDEHDELPGPPSPWTLAYDGSKGPVGWRTALGSRGPERSIGPPLLVTLGRTGMANVLANVAAMGTLCLEGAEQEVRRRQRSLSLEVATSRIAVPVEVAVAGDERLATLDQIRHIDDPDEEVRLSMEEVEQDIVLDDRTPRLLVCHRGVDPPELPGELRGMVGVLAATSVHGAWVVDVEDEHIGRLRLPGGGTVKLALPDVDPDVVDDELTRLDQPATEPVEQVAEADAPAADPSTNGRRAHPMPTTDPAWCEVRVLGPVEVFVDGQRVEGLTPRLLEVFAYLATHDAVSKERVELDVWAGEDLPPGTQRVKSALNKIRNLLGDDPDGNPLVPRRHNDELIQLSPHVGCDLDRALAHLALARDLPGEARARETASALDLVSGEPFQGQTYSWATEVSQHAIVKLQDAAVEAARTLREGGDLDAAATVIEQGHKLLSGNGWLYLEQAELEKARGHPERARRLEQQWRRDLGNDADEIAGTVAVPPGEVELAFRELMARL